MHEGKIVSLTVAKREPMRSEQEAFIIADLNDLPVPISREDGLMALMLAQKSVHSGTEQRIITL